ncbi:MAG: glycoside hydrolase family 2 TIM barrel-domain containing protein [Lachnospiraceae bacterium]
MIREKWNSNWRVSKSGDSPMMAAVQGQTASLDTITLPHDAMIHEKRLPDTKNQHQTGFYPGGVYHYTKTFDAPEEWKDKNIYLEFEGVYMNSMVYINGDYAGGHPYGYTNFYIAMDDFLKYGQANEIEVIANNSMEENSRWYSGSGIYRNVNLIIGNNLHIPLDGVRISTPEVEEDCATVQLEIKLENKGIGRHQIRLITELWDEEKKTAGKENTLVSVFSNQEIAVRQRILLNEPKLWDTETPHLYTCSVKVMEEGNLLDEVSEKFGVRTITMNAKHGLRLNGKEIKLRGSCIHHDNGIIGAVTLERAEERRCRQLKEAGFNCIRSAHNPTSRAMLDACDKIGMLVLDELSDMWTRSKNNNDYALQFPDYWEKDVEQLVARDYNHPSVIMYISGNEIQEAGTAKGAELNRIITEKFHSLDHTRYVTVSINGLLAGMEHMGEIMCSIMGITMEEMAEMMSAQASSQEESTGTSVDQANGSSDLMFGPTADAYAKSEILSGLLEEFSSVTDLVGYNYLTARHEMEHELYPNRVILGAETLPADIVRLWKIVKENPHVIGDMTWTGYDYLGEAGAYVFYYDERRGFMPNWPISVAYAGDIDIIGYRRPMSYYREIVYGIRNKPYIAVERVNHYGAIPNKSAWMWKDEIASWTWKGYEGKPAVVNVYSNADEVELFQNGKSLGRKPVSEDTSYFVCFETSYQPGKLEAVCYRGGVEDGRDELVTASEVAELYIEADRTVLTADGADLSYLTVCLKDKDGSLNLQAKKEVTISVEGIGTLQGFGSADPETKNSYDNTVWETYDGYLLAVIRAGEEAGQIKVTFTAEGCQEKIVNIKVI